MLFQITRNQKEAGVPIITSDKVDFNPKLLRREQEGHHILLIKRTKYEL
jgi:hypothetical protein